jgi:bifunctional non-homologous end joining protein LigD
LNRKGAPSTQLALDIGPSARAVLPERLRPMLPMAGDGAFDDAEWFFEPWWPGASTLAWIDDGRVRLQTEHLADPLEAFPELASIAAQFSDDALIVEGALLVLDDEGRPDGELLRRRLGGDTLGEHRGVAALVASDLLYASGQSQLDLPFDERRRRLGRVLSDGERAVVSRGLRGEGTTLAEAVLSMGLTEISARRLDAAYRPGTRDDSWLRISLVAEEPAPTRPLLALLQRLPLD